MTTYEQELERSGRILFTVRGISMRPLFRAGSDAISVKKCSAETLENLDIVLFKRKNANGEQYVLHRTVDRLPDGKFVIAGDNCSGADIVRPQDILGVVISAQRGNKPIKLDGLRYALYKKLWCKPYKMRFKILHCRDKARSAAGKIISLWRR
ncbi:MAG: S24/S26 family peptidase [Ruminococcus sp.]|uniref:S24/S26 family peptidase n=1 Tax=Ruminococcus sp. TaxID=41978 RepID=UPI0025F985BE|nr:S24/S26 family peptidase [Ruminococcus sp.]MBO4865100.1 S24/S26 family peptidase [Ruminococcus sp.]